MSVNIVSRLRGSLYGLAAGDALGAPYEFKPRGTYVPTGNMEESSIFTFKGKPLKAGTWTDDTSMALCLAASLNEHRGFIWEDAAKKFVRWNIDGYMSAIGVCFDIGNTTRVALGSYNYQLTHKANKPLVLSGPKDAHQSGNGSLMRLAPVPVFYHQSPKKALQYTSLQSRITHASPVAVQSCLLASLQIVGFVNSEKDTAKARKEEVLASRFVPKGLEGVDIEISEREIVNLWEGEWKSNTVDEISTSGFVVHSHEAALWALWNTETFEEGMLLLLPLGSDVDTVCAIYGQLAGACYGYESIPKRWLDGLQKREILDQVFGTLVELSSQVSDAETTAA